MGVTVLVASGDNGASDGSTNGALTVDFPSSSPYVIGCGGTKLSLTGNSIRSEQAWNELAQNEGATGGGVSEVFAAPAFQSGVHVPAAPNGFRGRGVPDVAADADPASGYTVLVDGESTVIGGTSAVAPLWAGLTRAHQPAGGQAGGVSESNPVFGGCGRHVSRHNFGQQQRLFGGSGMGSLHGTWHARRHTFACGSEKRLNVKKSLATRQHSQFISRSAW